MRTLTYQNRDVVEVDSGEGAVPRLYSLQDVPGLGGIRGLGGERLKTKTTFAVLWNRNRNRRNRNFLISGTGTVTGTVTC